MHDADPDEAQQPPRHPASDNPWRVASRFNVAGVERTPDPGAVPTSPATRQPRWSC